MCLAAGLGAAAGAHLRVLLSRPAGYLTGFFQSFRLAGFAPAEIPRWLLFFHEAVLVLDRLRKIGGSSSSRPLRFFGRIAGESHRRREGVAKHSRLS